LTKDYIIFPISHSWDPPGIEPRNLLDMKRFYICFVSAHQHNANDLFKALHSLPQRHIVLIVLRAQGAMAAAPRC